MDNNLYDMLSDNPKINITVSARQLKDAIDYCVLKTREELKQQIVDGSIETYLSVEKTAKMLEVHRSTLFRWVEKDYLVPIEVGGLRRYRLSDVNRILEHRKNKTQNESNN
jgi:excisionase family DNA binding protein